MYYDLPKDIKNIVDSYIIDNVSVYGRCNPMNDWILLAVVHIYNLEYDEYVENNIGGIYKYYKLEFNGKNILYMTHQTSGHFIYESNVVVNNNCISLRIRGTSMSQYNMMMTINCI